MGGSWCREREEEMEWEGVGVERGGGDGMGGSWCREREVEMEWEGVGVEREKRWNGRELVYIMCQTLNTLISYRLTYCNDYYFAPAKNIRTPLLMQKKVKHSEIVS